MPVAVLSRAVPVGTAVAVAMKGVVPFQAVNASLGSEIACTRSFRPVSPSARSVVFFPRRNVSARWAASRVPPTQFSQLRRESRTRFNRAATAEVSWRFTSSVPRYWSHEPTRNVRPVLLVKFARLVLKLATPPGSEEPKRRALGPLAISMRSML